MNEYRTGAVSAPHTAPPAPTAERNAPDDITEAHAMLSVLFHDLTDLMQEAVSEWRSELRDAVKEWRDGGNEPDFNSFREWLNDICRDDGMPILFPKHSSTGAVSAPPNAKPVEADVIYSYTRAQAIADGVLVDVTHATDANGQPLSIFKCPVAFTRTAYDETIAAGGHWQSVPDGDGEEVLVLPASQDVAGRLWDVFSLIAQASALPENRRASEFRFNVRVDVLGDGHPQLVALKVVASPGDEGEMVLTIMLPHED